MLLTSEIGDYGGIYWDEAGWEEVGLGCGRNVELSMGNSKFEVPVSHSSDAEEGLEGRCLGSCLPSTIYQLYYHVLVT